MQVRNLTARRDVEDANLYGKTEVEIKTDRGVYLGVEDEGDHENSTEDDGLENIWNEMSMALEVSKVSLKRSIAIRERLFFLSPVCLAYKVLRKKRIFCFMDCFMTLFFVFMWSVIF